MNTLLTAARAGFPESTSPSALKKSGCEKWIRIFLFLWGVLLIDYSWSLEDPLSETDPAQGDSYNVLLSQATEGKLELDAKDKEGRPVIIAAILYGTIDDVRKLLELGYSANSHFMTLSAVHYAVADSCQENKLTALIEAGADVTDAEKVSGSRPIHLAAQNKDISCLKRLIDAGADPNARDHRGRTAYFYALDFSNSNAIDLLWQSGSDPELEDDTGLDVFQYAILGDHAELVKPLILRLIRTGKLGN